MERSSFVWIGVVLFVIVVAALVWLAGERPQEQAVVTPPVVQEPTQRPPPRTLTFQASLTSDFFAPASFEVYTGDTVTVEVLSAGTERIVQLLAFGQEQTIAADAIGRFTFSPTKAGDYPLTCVSACAEGVALTIHVR